MELEKERLKDWFWKKYDWEVYKEVEEEMYKRHLKEYSLLKRLIFLFNGIPEKDRLWLIKETNRRLELMWKKRTAKAKR